MECMNWRRYRKFWMIFSTWAKNGMEGMEVNNLVPCKRAENSSRPIPAKLYRNFCASAISCTAIICISAAFPKYFWEIKEAPWPAMTHGGRTIRKSAPPKTGLMPIKRRPFQLTRKQAQMPNQIQFHMKRLNCCTALWKGLDCSSFKIWLIHQWIYHCLNRNLFKI